MEKILCISTTSPNLGLLADQKGIQSLGADELDQAIDATELLTCRTPQLSLKDCLDGLLETGKIGIDGACQSLAQFLNESKLEDNLRARYRSSKTQTVRRDLARLQAASRSINEDAAILVIDGKTTWDGTLLGVSAPHERPKLLAHTRYPNHLELLLRTFENLPEGGSPNLTSKILNEFVELNRDGSFRLNPKWLKEIVGSQLAQETLQPFNPSELRSSLESVLGEIVLRLARTLKSVSRKNHLVIASYRSSLKEIVLRVQNENLFNEVEFILLDDAAEAHGAIQLRHPELASKTIDTKNQITPTSPPPLSFLSKLKLLVLFFLSVPFRKRSKIELIWPGKKTKSESKTANDMDNYPLW